MENLNNQARATQLGSKSMRWGAAQGEDRVGRVMGDCPYRVLSKGVTGLKFPF